jgi:PAS domain S-box-containing protein
VALVLGLTVAGFIVARVLAERDVRHGSERRVEIAAAQIRSRVEAATSLTESLRRFLSDEGATGVTDDAFATNALRWLDPADLPGAAWVEEVRAADRASYERRIGRPIVTPDQRRRAVPPASSYLPATLISGIPPMDSRGVDLRREPGIAAALDRAINPGGVGATSVAARRDGTRGLFLVAPTPNLIDGVLRPGAVVVFLSEATLRAAARSPAGLRFSPAGRSSDDRAGGDTVRDGFAVAGQQFAVVMPKESVSGAGAILPWIILAGGLLLAALAGALGVIAARRARAQQDFDRIFNLSPDLVAVANFDGYFTRVNPAAEQILGYTEDELLARPYLDFVRPDDRERTAAETAAIGDGKTTLVFENRYIRKDGSYRVLEWTATPVAEERLLYSVGRDVTRRRQVEAEVERLAHEQAALRRVATLVAKESSPAEVFAMVAEEVARVLGDVDCALWRDEGDGTASAVAVRGASACAGVRVGTRLSLDGESVTALVLRDGRSHRIEDYSAALGTIAVRAREIGIRAATGCPIVVGGRTWGAMGVATYAPEPFPPGTETRLEQFSELVATSIANADARAEVERLAEEQAALRRVATLVAQGASPTAVFDAVAAEMERLLDADETMLSRYEPNADFTVVANRGAGALRASPGARVRLDGDNVQSMVRRTGRPARWESFQRAPPGIADVARITGGRSVVGAPILVDGRLWGVISASWNHEESPSAETEERMAQFAQLLDTAIANADSRDQLTASRARLVTAGDDARRRVVRDLHDGAQQRLVHTIVTLKLATRAFCVGDGKAEAFVGEALGHAHQANSELRELAHGILPIALTSGGLRAGVDSLVERFHLPVDVELPAQRFPAEIEASAYFIVAEALTNVVKHADARHAAVRATVKDGVLRVEVRDDGVGGADPQGHGLVGIGDRASALGGRLEIDSPPGGGTLVVVALLLPAS